MADPHREAHRLRELEIADRALRREWAVVNYYAARGYRVLTTTDDETRALFGIPAAEKAADIIVELSPTRVIIAEVKGGNIGDAVDQLANTTRYAIGRYPYIECKIFSGLSTPPGDSVPLRGGLAGYRALRVFHAGFPGEWLLYEYTGEGNTRLVEIGSSYVTVIFGPYV